MLVLVLLECAVGLAMVGCPLNFDSEILYNRSFDDDFFHVSDLCAVVCKCGQEVGCELKPDVEFGSQVRQRTQVSGTLSYFYSSESITKRTSDIGQLDMNARQVRWSSSVERHLVKFGKRASAELDERTLRQAPSN